MLQSCLVNDKWRVSFKVNGFCLIIFKWKQEAFLLYTVRNIFDTKAYCFLVIFDFWMCFWVTFYNSCFDFLDFGFLNERQKIIAKVFCGFKGLHRFYHTVNIQMLKRYYMYYLINLFINNNNYLQLKKNTKSSSGIYPKAES